MADDKPKKVDVTNVNVENQEKINKLAKDHLGIVLDWNKAMAGYNKEGYEILENLRQRQRIERAIKKDTKAYFEYVKEIKENEKEIVAIQKEINKLGNQLNGKTKEQQAVLKKQIAYLDDQANKLREQNALIKDQINKTNKLKVAWAGVSKGFSTTKKTYDKIDSLLSTGFLGDMFKSLKVLKVTTSEMGVIGERAKLIQQNIKRATINTVNFGISLEDVAKIQSSFSDELGTTQAVSEEALQNLSMMGKVTGIGAEAMGKMAGEMGGFGYNADRSAKFVDQVMKDTTAMGLNTAKVLKNIQGNIKLLNKYNFKNGIKGLSKMAEKTTKMGVSLTMAAGMADKLFDIEGAVEMSAQLQVMGGEWAKLGDPFKLMYMARNDMEGLTTSIINATKSSAKFNSKTGEFDISALKMHELRKVAEATGLNFEELAASAKNAAKFASIGKQMKFKFDDTTKEFIENTSSLDEKGRAMIMVGAEKKYLDALTESDKRDLEKMAQEKKSLKERALEATTFDDQFKALITKLKLMLLPILDRINDVIVPKFNKLLDTLGSKKIVEGIEGFAKNIPIWFEKVKEIGKSIFEFIKGVGEFVAKFPKISLGVGAGIVIAFKGLQWLSYGRILGLGFNSVARVSGAGGTGPGKGGKGGFMGGRINKMSIGAGLAGMGINAITDATTEAGSTGNIIGKAAGSALEFGSLGFMIGGPWGAAIGGVLGGLYGGISAAMSKGEDEVKNAENSNKASINDGVVFNPKDKFMKMNDGTMIAGTNVNGNKELAKAIMASSVPTVGPLVDYLTKSSSQQNFSAAQSSQNEIKLSDLRIDGTIRLEMSNSSENIDSNKLLKNKYFIRDLGLAINKSQAEGGNGKNR